MANVVLYGLDAATANQIGSALEAARHQVHPRPANTSVEEVFSTADVVFAAQYLPLLQALRRKHLELPVIVVTRIPETPDWLDALEAGATDYCCAPFDAKQIQWMMETALARPQACSAAA